MTHPPPPGVDVGGRGSRSGLGPDKTPSGEQESFKGCFVIMRKRPGTHPLEQLGL